MQIDIDLEKMVKDSLARNLNNDEEEIAKLDKKFGIMLDSVILHFCSCVFNKIIYLNHTTPKVIDDWINDQVDVLVKEALRLCGNPCKNKE